jgi:hypothetical protein
MVLTNVGATTSFGIHISDIYEILFLKPLEKRNGIFSMIFQLIINNAATGRTSACCLSYIYFAAATPETSLAAASLAVISEL